jgi:hypothetical protein
MKGNYIISVISVIYFRVIVPSPLKTNISLRNLHYVHCEPPRDSLTDQLSMNFYAPPKKQREGSLSTSPSNLNLSQAHPVPHMFTPVQQMSYGHPHPQFIPGHPGLQSPAYAHPQVVLGQEDVLRIAAAVK